jgi:hypothetical protein
MRYEVTAVSTDGREATMPAHGLTQETAEIRVLKALRARDTRDGVDAAWRVTQSFKAPRD